MSRWNPAFPFVEEDRGYETPCHIWQGAIAVNGYGLVRRGGVMRRAHRWAWEQVNGSIPDGLVMDHLCRNRPCVNPAHVEPVTQAENVRRGRLCRVPEDVVDAIRSAEGSQRIIAQRFGVSQQYVSRIKSGAARGVVVR